ncbi:MAG TPA: metallophosphoesterase [Steroidobacteraceae bacterium]|nr:metallophosphoesterase [Steroidobacteraceae bacterium]
MRRVLAAAFILLQAALAAAQSPSAYRFTGVERVVAFADVHGAYEPLVALLRETGVVDESLRWSGGRTHLVGLGDLVDRGPQSRQVLDLLMRLEGEAAAAGGAVHQLLGNHEVMDLAGDLRYVSPAEYAAYAGPQEDAGREAAWKAILAKDSAASRAEFDAAFPPGYFGHAAAFAPDGRYGRWLLGKPVIVVINDTAFVHGGLPPLVARLGLEDTNAAMLGALRDYLEAWRSLSSTHGIARPVLFDDRPAALAAIPAPADAESLGKLQDGPVFTPAGPTWYRGQALCNPYTETENLDAALARLGVARVVEGHTVTATGRVLQRFDSRVWLLDTGMLAPVYKGRASALVFQDGAWSVTYADAPGQRFRPEPAPRAVGPRPRSLDDDALERWLAEAEVAAYRLDRLLGLGLVPVTVERAVNGKPRVVQFWIDESMTVREMLERKLAPSGWCPSIPQYNLMNVFDLLAHNPGRTADNALFTRDWMLVLTGHARAFGTGSAAPSLLSSNPVELSPALARKLGALDRATLDAALGPYLSRRQVDALVKRRDDLLRRFGGASAEGRSAAR